MEVVHQTDDKNRSTINLSSMEVSIEAELSNLNSIHTSSSHSFRQPLNFSGKNLHSMKVQSLANVLGEVFYPS